MEFRYAEEKDASLILQFIKELAAYEKMLVEVVATEALLKEWIFEKKQRSFSHWKLGMKSDLLCSFITFQPFLGERASIWRTCTSSRSIAERVTERLS